MYKKYSSKLAKEKMWPFKNFHVANKNDKNLQNLFQNLKNVSYVCFVSLSYSLDKHTQIKDFYSTTEIRVVLARI